MDDGGAPTLEVGFAIDFANSFVEMARLEGIIDNGTARVLAEFAKLERASTGLLNLDGSVVSVKSFGDATTREARNAARELAKIETAGERLVRQLERQNATMGKTRNEILAMDAAAAALAAEEKGLTELAGRLTTQHQALANATGKIGGTSRASAQNLAQLSFQMNDVFVGLASGQKPMTVFIQQGAQIFQIAQMTEGGLVGLSRAAFAAILPFAPLAAGLAVAAGGFALFERAISKGVDTNALVNSLGLTHKEIKRLKDVSVDAGDVISASFQVLAKNVGINLSGMTQWFGQSLDYMTTVGRQALASLYSQFVGTFRAIGIIVRDVFAGKAIGDILADVGHGYTAAFKEADAAMVRFGAAVTKQVRSNKLAELQKQAAAIKADRTPKTDHHAEQLEREAKATEAQIRNLYDLAKAYRASDAAALIAEARVKAESEAIKKQANIAAAVDRLVRLAIAQRVADGEKAMAAARGQAAAQEEVNRLVAAGLVPAARAAEQVRDRIADLPLLVALQAAQQQGLAKEAAAATQALDDQRTARERLRAAEADASFNAAQSSAQDRLDMISLETRLIGENEAARVHALATLKAWQEAQAQGWDIDQQLEYVRTQVALADAMQKLSTSQAQFNGDLRLTAELADSLGDSLAKAFGKGGAALGDMVKILGTYGDRQAEIDKQVNAGNYTRDQGIKKSADLQLTSLLDLTGAAKGLFKEHSAGYKAMEAAEKALTIVQIARTAVAVAEGAANMFAAAGPGGFPLVAAMLGVMASLGFAGGGGGGAAPKYNDGKGTVFGDSDAKSDSIKRSLDLLGDIDTDMLAVSRQMAASLKNIESQIGGVTNLVLRNGLDNVEGKLGVQTGFKPDAIGKALGAAPGALVGSVLGSLMAGPLGAVLGHAVGALFSKVIYKIPVLGDILGGIGKIFGSLFGTKTKVVGSGIFGGPQSFGDIEDLGFAGQSFVDIKRTKKFLGVSTGSKYKTKFGDLDDSIEQQFGLLLTSFGDAIKLAAGPLGLDLDAITAKLDSFVVDIGKIDLKGLSGDEIQEKLEAVFGAQADKMAQFAIAGLEKFQKVGEGYFETLVRVASTVEVVTSSLQLLGLSAQSIGLDASMAISGFFDSVSDYQSAAGAYFETYYSEAEQTAAKTAALGKVFASLGVAMPDSIAGFRALVEAQDLGTAAGQQLYAQLLQIAPAFAEVANAGRSAASAAAILRERQDLQKQIWELEGNTAAIRKAEIDALDPSNRALLERIYALKDQQAAEAAAEQRRAAAAQRAQEAAQAAKQLADAWKSAGDSILEEINRIRGLSQSQGQSYAQLLGQFDAANFAARKGDIDAAKALPGLSKALLDMAAGMATSSLDLIDMQNQAAAALATTYAVIGGGAVSSPATTAGQSQSWWQKFSSSQVPSAGASANDDLVAELRSVRAELADTKERLTARLDKIVTADEKTANVLDRAARLANAEGTPGALATTEVAA